MLRIASCGEGVRRLIGNHPKLRHRQPHSVSEILDKGSDSREDLRIFGGRHALRRVHGKRNLIREKVAEKVHHSGEAEAYVEALFACNGAAADYQDST